MENLFFYPDINSDIISFDSDESKHIIKVLRMKIGDEIFLTDGKGFLYTAELQEVNQKKCQAIILNKEFFEQPRNYNIDLAIAPTKNNNRYEWMLEKSVEFGLDSITPIICEHSERRNINSDRLNRIAISATKQSKKFYSTTINNQIPLQDYIKNNNADIKLIAWCKTTEEDSIIKHLQKDKSYSILIGPEGDFSNSEVEFAEKHGYIAVNLGQSRLRTETAGLAVCSALYFNI